MVLMDEAPILRVRQQEMPPGNCGCCVAMRSEEREERVVLDYEYAADFGDFSDRAENARPVMYVINRFYIEDVI